MSSYITERNKIIQTHKLLLHFLDSNIINNLVHLFDMRYIKNNSNYTITKYVENERIIQGLDTSNVDIRSEVYGYKNRNPTLFLIINKNNIDFIHITIHLAPKSFDPKNDGLIHFYKDIYKLKELNIPKRSRYSFIEILYDKDKPNSLEFSLVNDNLIRNATKSEKYDIELEKEMNVIITVLNHLFDENNIDFYIGNTDKLLHIHNNTNNVLRNINAFTTHVTRKNRGLMMYPPIINNKVYNISDIPKKSHKIKTSFTRKKK